MARLAQIVIDCRNPARLARFWESALDEFVVRAYDEAEVARLASLGFTPDTDPTVMLDGPLFEICFQQGDAQASWEWKRPLHLDIASRDRAAEVARLEALGATVAARFDSHTWLRDPENNDFCVTEEQHSST